MCYELLHSKSEVERFKQRHHMYCTKLGVTDSYVCRLQLKEFFRAHMVSLSILLNVSENEPMDW
jgi:hypothetical protein